MFGDSITVLYVEMCVVSRLLCIEWSLKKKKTPRDRPIQYTYDGRKPPETSGRERAMEVGCPLIFTSEYHSIVS